MDEPVRTEPALAEPALAEPALAEPALAEPGQGVDSPAAAAAPRGHPGDKLGDKPGDKQPRWRHLPYAVVVAGVAGGLALMSLGPRQVKAGMVIVGTALLAAAAARLVLPERGAGLLASRRRLGDVLALACLGVCIMAVALVLPPS